MTLISDEDLVLYHYRDGLEEARLAEISAALRAEPEVAARYSRLSAELATAAAAFRVDEPDSRFEERVWNRLAPELPAEPVLVRLARWWRRPRLLVPAGALALALLIGVLLGRTTWTEDQVPVPKNSLSTSGDDFRFQENGGARVLSAYVSDHLAATERALLIAANSPDEAETARELARALIAANRLYASAAERADRPQLVRFLRELEPVLLMLAHSDLPDEEAAIREWIRRRDLPFKTRAARAAARRDLAL